MRYDKAAMNAMKLLVVLLLVGVGQASSAELVREFSGSRSTTTPGIWIFRQ